MLPCSGRKRCRSRKGSRSRRPRDQGRRPEPIRPPCRSRSWLRSCSSRINSRSRRRSSGVSLAPCTCPWRAPSRRASSSRCSWLNRRIASRSDGGSAPKRPTGPSRTPFKRSATWPGGAGGGSGGAAGNGRAQASGATPAIKAKTIAQVMRKRMKTPHRFARAVDVPGYPGPGACAARDYVIHADVGPPSPQRKRTTTERNFCNTLCDWAMAAERIRNISPT